MKFGRRFEEEAESIQMAPLIDIVFLTLVFFITIVTYATLESEIDIELPTASSAVQSSRTMSEIYINLRDDGRIVMNNREMTIEQLQDVLNRVAELAPGGAVIIRGDGEAALGRAIAILNCCRNADISNVSFAALTEDVQEVASQ
jgi:biopolymer transport protein ExbD